VRINSSTDCKPVAVSIFVYIDVASAEKRRASCGMCRSRRSLMTEVEFFRYDLMKGRSSFILKSSQVEKIDSRLPQLLTTEQRSHWVLMY